MASFDVVRGVSVFHLIEKVQDLSFHFTELVLSRLKLARNLRLKCLPRLEYLSVHRRAPCGVLKNPAPDFGENLLFRDLTSKHGPAAANAVTGSRTDEVFSPH